MGRSGGAGSGASGGKGPPTTSTPNAVNTRRPIRQVTVACASGRPASWSVRSVQAPNPKLA
jgi:hypothetical protein